MITPVSTPVEMVRALRQKQISAAELLALHIQQVEQHNPTLNAIVIHDDEAARRAALLADEALRRGATGSMLGLPFTVKDWIEVGGMRSTAGDADLATSGYTGQQDSLVIQRLRSAGAIPFAKTNMAPWGSDWKTDNPVFGRTNNPWDLDRTPGGSTGGGAAAVAAGLSPLEIGNDIGGSVRIPAAFTGIYGHKPSETAWPRSGQTPDPRGLHLPNPATGLAMMGPLARSAPDLALALSAGAGADQGEDTAWCLMLPPTRHTRIQNFRVAVLPPISWLPVEDEILQAQDRLVEELHRQGAVVEECQPEGMGDWRDFYLLYHKLSIAVTSPSVPKEARREIAEWARQEAERRSSDLFAAGAEAFSADAADYISWFGAREIYRSKFRRFFKDWDVLLTPVCMVNAFRHSESPVDVDLDEITFQINNQAVPYRYLGFYPSLATLCGQPATVFPMGLTRSKLPVGLQAIGPYLEDFTPIQFADCISEALGGYTPPPNFESN